MTRLLGLFLLLYSVTQGLCDKSFISTAVSQIIRDFYVKNSENFDFVVFGFGCEAEKLKDLVNDVVEVTSDVSPYKVIVVARDGKRVGLSQSAVLLFDNLESFNEFHNRVDLMNSSARKFHFLVYIKDLRTPLNVPERLGWELMFSQESFIQESSNGSINLLTYSKFHQPNCKQWQVEVLNNFSQSERKWMKKDFFVEKFKNFNGCELVTEARMWNQPYSKCDFNDNQEFDKCWGSGILMNEEIGRHLNYTSWYNPSHEEIHNKTVENQHSIFITSLRLQHSTKNQFLAMHPFTTREIFIIIARDSLYTQFEKLFLPFEIEVWILLIATMSIGVLTILIVKLAPPTVQTFVFGSQVTTPMLNFIIVSFGLGMVRMPGRNFARFLLMCFILFCLVMRTAYQGKQFEFLTKEMRRPDMKTIEELIEKNFTIYAVADIINILQDMELIRRVDVKLITTIEIHDPAFMKNLLSDGSKRAVIITSAIHEVLYNKEKGNIDFARLEDSIITDHVTFFFKNNSIMIEPFNRKLMQLTEAGISDQIVKAHGKHFYVEPPDDKIVLTLDHLGVGFYIWLGCLGICLTFFLLEFLWKKFRR